MNITAKRALVSIIAVLSIIAAIAFARAVTRGSFRASRVLPNALAQAKAAGYSVNTFSADFAASKVDETGTGKAGYDWYLWNIFGDRANHSAIKLNADHSVTLLGDTTGPNGELVTATPAGTPRGFVGTAFGGGAYIEAELKFNPNDCRPGTKGWPSFWALPVEGSVHRVDQWPGQPSGYIHSVEVDIFEYLHFRDGGSKEDYGAGMHDWYGIYKATCPHDGFCQEPSKDGRMSAPIGTDFSQYHRYGFLWIPATKAAPGLGRFFFDGETLGNDVQWAQFTNQSPPPKGQPWAFGRLDQQHLVLILGTGPNQAITVKSVNVWQKSASENLRY